MLMLWLLLSAIGWGFPPVFGSPDATEQGEDPYVSGALYVKFSHKTVNYMKSAKRDYPVSFLLGTGSFSEKFGLHPMAYSMHLFTSSALDDVFRIGFDSVCKTDELIELLEKEPQVEFVERVPRIILDRNYLRVTEQEKATLFFWQY